MSSKSINTMNKVPTFEDLIRSFPKVKSILFDMDGTLFNTERYHALALKNLGRDLKIKSPLSEQELFHLMVGKADHLLFDIIKLWPGFPNEVTVEDFINLKNQQLLQVLQKTSSHHYFSEDIRNLLQEFQKNNLSIGLVTSSEKIITYELLKISQIQIFFDFILTRDDSLRVKPDPWPYEFAMNKLSCSPEQTLIFEDSLVGLEAAQKSGAFVIKANWYET